MPYPMQKLIPFVHVALLDWLWYASKYNQKPIAKFSVRKYNEILEVLGCPTK